MKIEFRFDVSAPVEVVLAFVASYFGKMEPIPAYTGRVGNQLIELGPMNNPYHARPGRWYGLIHTTRPSTVRHVLAVITGFAQVSEINVRVLNESHLTSVDFAGTANEEVFSSMAEKSADEADRLRAENGRLAAEVADRDQLRAELEAFRETLARGWLPRRLRKKLGVERRVVRY